MADYRRPQYMHSSCCVQKPSDPTLCVSKPQEPPAPIPAFDPACFPVAMFYVPWQAWSAPYELECALKTGTIFPDLNRPFLGVRKGGCMK